MENMTKDTKAVQNVPASGAEPKKKFSLPKSKKAKKWLDEHGVEYVDRDITTENPTAAELAEWHERSGLPLRRLFNTSGMKYRELGIKAKLDAGMTDAECFDLLATDGMLVKRPLLVGDDFVIPGFKEQAWAEALGLNL